MAYSAKWQQQYNGYPGDEATPRLAEIETEAWESLLALCRGMLDFLVDTQAEGSNSEARQTAQETFVAVEKLRRDILSQTPIAFNGKFKMLWLQEV